MRSSSLRALSLASVCIMLDQASEAAGTACGAGRSGKFTVGGPGGHLFLQRALQLTPGVDAISRAVIRRRCWMSSRRRSIAAEGLTCEPLHAQHRRQAATALVQTHPRRICRVNWLGAFVKQTQAAPLRTRRRPLSRLLQGKKRTGPHTARPHTRDAACAPAAVIFNGGEGCRRVQASVPAAAMCGRGRVNWKQWHSPGGPYCSSICTKCGPALRKQFATVPGSATGMRAASVGWHQAAPGSLAPELLTACCERKASYGRAGGAEAPWTDGAWKGFELRCNAWLGWCWLCWPQCGGTGRLFLGAAALHS
ncbi:uncharacterized protein BDZ99DRAFT_520092 [Mytilinidion resinicola]|uniref:Uncharacterized protein n=1 Tax=Mytilinidion resinicola TaxID=574789 RepID=A0A6A6YMN0_9PEZI|nr:uncharacterized protein BDZ99DRAFT_520092 [Mytilinidion resinicola]KAF2810001.1 hypothetical protein BDZ99DRAFT_520092 [Mytilinidion resinicola]